MVTFTCPRCGKQAIKILDHGGFEEIEAVGWLFGPYREYVRINDWAVMHAGSQCAITVEQANALLQRGTL